MTEFKKNVIISYQNKEGETMTVIKAEEKKAEGRIEPFGVMVLRAKNGKVKGSWKTGNKRVSCARVKKGKLTEKQLKGYRKMAKKCIEESLAANPWYFSNYR